MYKPVVNMADIKAKSEKALIMKDMGNGHMRPFMWGTTVTVASGGTAALVASGTMAGVDVNNCVYTLSNGLYYISKDSVERTVEVKILADTAAAETVIDIMVFMSTAVDVDVNDYTGKRGYQSGNY